jgi:hypothetical protein
MMHHTHLSRRLGIGSAVLLALITAGTASAAANLRSGELEECPIFHKTAPANGATVPAIPTLTWSAAYGAVRYEVCVDADGNNTCDSGWTSVGSLREYVPAGLTPGVAYSWQVRVFTAHESAQADGGAWWTFTILPPAPAAFGKSAPANLSAQPVNPTLAWAASAGAESYEYCYDTTDNGACDGSWTSAGTSVSAALGGLANSTVYFWQVRAVNAGGTTDADGGTWWSFTTVPAGPGSFGKTAPADPSYQPLSPTLNWAASAGALSYEYCYDSSNDGACGTSWVSTGSATSAGLSGLGNNRTYYWQVRATNAQGTTEADGGAWWRFTSRFQRFADVPIDHPYWAEIEAFYLAGITTGCGVSPLIYCPDQNVTRAAMAVFILRSKYGSSYTPPPATHTFADLPVAGKEWQEAWVDQYYLEGITSGCGTSPLRYCPENPVTRAAMAVFMLRAKYGAAYAPPAATHIFADLPVAGKEWMEAWVDQAYSEGIVTACGTAGPTYCPEASVTRMEMAAFIVYAFNFPLP